jgi:hypothetical protein
MLWATSFFASAIFSAVRTLTTIGRESVGAALEASLLSRAITRYVTRVSSPSGVTVTVADPSNER